MFNTKYINHLEKEIEEKGKRIAFLENWVREITDAKLFNRMPERLVKEVEKKGDSKTSASTTMGDAYSIAMEEAWRASTAKTKEDEEPKND
jgi:hypothetical protein